MAPQIQICAAANAVANRFGAVDAINKMAGRVHFSKK